MGSEDYIELPPNPLSDNEDGNNGGELSTLQEVSKEDSGKKVWDVRDQEPEVQEYREENRGVEKLDLHEEGNEYEGKNNLGILEAGKGGAKENLNILKECEQDGGNENKEMNFHLSSSLVSAAEVNENGGQYIKVNESVKVDISSRSGVKRARLMYMDDQPSVHIVYNHLTRESKKKLAELLQHWSEWHSQYSACGQGSTEEPLECGDEIYFPALHVGGGNTSLMSFWMDKPARQILKEQIKDNASQEKEVNIPLYDRAYEAALTSQDGFTNSECSGELSKEASRCFNCGSYSHSLKDCSKPRDNAAINNARNQHKAKRAPASGPRCPARYYQNSPGGKYEGIKPGMLGSEARQCLGIGELDPPPWLNRMREIGYPPGYLDSDVPDQRSGIVIYTDDDNMDLEEDGEIFEGEPSNSSANKKMTVHFPGINAPIPENADKRLWSVSHCFGSVAGSDTPNAGHKSDSGHIYGRQSSLSIKTRGNHFDQTRSGNYDSLPDDPPGTEHAGNHAFNSDYASRGILGNNTPSPNYSAESQQSRMRYPFSRSPSLTRSVSDRSPSLTRSVSDNGRRSPIVQDISPRGVHPQPTNSRYGEHGRNPHGQYSPRTPAQYSSPSPGRYSPQTHSPGSTDYMLPERRHAWAETYAALDATQRKDRSEGSHYHRR